jgi:hypothetical protein
MYLSSADPRTGDEILQKEKEVTVFLESILASPEKFSLKAYSRTGVSFQIKRTELLSHAFYVIIADETGYHTLSFYGTKIAFYSEGAWILDGGSDFSSYKMFAEGDNKWDVAEIVVENGIDAEQTAKNILKKINSATTYYYKDHIKNKPGVDNCNTALLETLAEKKL